RIHDVIAIEHLPRLPPDHLHGDALRDAGAEQVPDRRAAEVVKHASRHAARAAGARPGLVEAADRLAARAREDETVPVARVDPPPCEKRAEIGREREHPTLAGLR